MAVIELFSKRQKKLRGEVSDVYVYDDIPKQLKTQIVHIWYDALGHENQYNNNKGKVRKTYQEIVETLCREYGLFKLPGTNDYDRHYIVELKSFFLSEQNTEQVLDVVELTFRVIDGFTRGYNYLDRHDADSTATNAIEELNFRFKEHSVGFQYIDRNIIRIDSDLIHSEVVKPALRLLNQKYCTGAQQEFLMAHEHYQHRNMKESLNECLKSFESLMKAICDKRGWSYNPNATAKNLIQVCLDNELIPSYWQQSFTSLRTLLESSVPTGRNKLSGHGQGSATMIVPDYLAAYMLHMTASAIVFLSEADAAMP